MLHDVAAFVLLKSVTEFNISMSFQVKVILFYYCLINFKCIVKKKIIQLKPK